jgi:hypothetical protein
MSTGMPAGIWLNKFGVIVKDAFGHVPYHVGSSLWNKDWRDVDVRLILPDDEFDRLFGQPRSEVNAKLSAFTLAFAALGREMTGLPIDFQIQRQTEANAKYPGNRGALIEVQPVHEWVSPELSRITIAEWAPTWLASKSALKGRTASSYESLWRTVVKPQWGDIRLDRVTYADAVTWVAGLTAGGMSASRVSQALLCLKQILDLAVLDGRLSRNAVKAGQASTATTIRASIPHPCAGRPTSRRVRAIRRSVSGTCTCRRLLRSPVGRIAGVAGEAARSPARSHRCRRGAARSGD